MLGPVHDPRWRRFVGIIFIISSPLPIAGTLLALQQGKESALIGGPIFWLVLVVLGVQFAKLTVPSVRREMESKRKPTPKAHVSKRVLLCFAVTASVASVLLTAFDLSPIGPVSTGLLLLGGFWWGFVTVVRRAKLKSQGRDSPPPVR